MLRFYFEVACATYRRQLVYRWANVAGLLTNIFFATIASFLFIALFQARPHAAGFDTRQALQYIWAVQAMIMIVLPFGWFELMLSIRSGAVITDLNKPCDFCWYWFSREVGRDAYYLLFRAIPTYVAGMLLFQIGAPQSLTAWLSFLPCLMLGALLGIAYRFIYNAIAFWTLEGRAIGGLAQVIALFFTGSYIPIPLFPGWLRAIAAALPFNGLMNVPAEALLSKLNGLALAQNIGLQAIWLVALVALARLLTLTAQRRLVVQGG